MIPRKRSAPAEIQRLQKVMENVDPNGGAIQFFRRASAEEEKRLNALANVPTGKRWRSPQRPDAAVVKCTKSEAIAWFKNLLGVRKLPAGFKIEAF